MKNYNITIREASLLLEVKVDTLYGYISRKKILPPRKTIGGSYYFTIADLKKIKPQIETLRKKNYGYFKKGD